MMKAMVAGFFLCAIAVDSNADMTASSHPLYGRWSWTYEKNKCTEVYDYHADNTSMVTSGEERAESRFTISDKPDLNGFYRLVDVATKSNGRTGCDGEPGGTPVGDTATLYIFFKPTNDEMIMCQEPSFKACMGPLHRISQ